MERAKPRDELASAQAPGRLDGHGPLDPVLDIGRGELTGELVADMTGPQDDARPRRRGVGARPAR